MYKILASLAALALALGVVYYSITASAPQTPATAETTQVVDTGSVQAPADSSAPASGTAASASPYADGTYTATGTYRTPESTEQITVTLSLKSGVVTDASVSQGGIAPETRRYQAQFASGFKQYVVGKSIDSLSLSRVSGSSLTSGGFNSAVAAIKAQAQG